MREKVLIAREGEKAISNNKDIGTSIDKKFHDHTYYAYACKFSTKNKINEAFSYG